MRTVDFSCPLGRADIYIVVEATKVLKKLW